MPDQAPRVSIVIPARNEEARLPASIREIRRAFPSEEWEFLIVVEPASDRTEEVARREAAGDPHVEILLNPTALGKGYAVKTGMLSFSRVRLGGFGFDVEAMALAEMLEFRVLDLPVEWADVAGSKLKPLRDGALSLVEAILAVRRVRRECKRICQPSE